MPRFVLLQEYLVSECGAVELHFSVFEVSFIFGDHVESLLPVFKVFEFELVFGDLHRLREPEKSALTFESVEVFVEAGGSDVKSVILYIFIHF